MENYSKVVEHRVSPKSPYKAVISEIQRIIISNELFLSNRAKIMLNHFGSRATLRPALCDIRIKNNLILIPFIAYNTRCVSEMRHVTKVTLIKLNIARSIQYIFYRRVARCYEVPTLCCVDLLYSISISMEMEYEVFGYTMHGISRIDFYKPALYYMLQVVDVQYCSTTATLE